MEEVKSDPEIQAASEGSDSPDDQVNQEFQNAFGFANNQAQSNDDDLVDLKLKTMLHEFIKK